MSVGLIVALIVAIAVVLTLAVDNDDDRTNQVAAPAAPLSYYSDGSGDGLVGGEGQAVVPALRSYTSELQGEGHLNTLDDLSAYRPTDRPTTGFHPYTEEVGLTDGDVTLSYEEQARLAHDEMLFEKRNDPLGLTYEEQARLAHDEMLFKEWNDPLGWQATSEPQAVLSAEDIRFLEMNGVYDFGDFGRDLAVVPAEPAVDRYERMMFIEMNTNLPVGTDGLPQPRGHGQLTEN